MCLVSTKNPKKKKCLLKFHYYLYGIFLTTPQKFLWGSFKNSPLKYMMKFVYFYLPFSRFEYLIKVFDVRSLLTIKQKLVALSYQNVNEIYKYLTTFHRNHALMPYNSEVLCTLLLQNLFIYTRHRIGGLHTLLIM